MLALSVFLVCPELAVGFVPCMLPELGFLIVGTKVGLHNLVYRIVENLLRLLRLEVLYGVVAVERQPHEDAVEPYLVGVDSLVPVNAFLGARLVLKLFEERLQCQFAALAREEVVHAEDELRGAHIVEIEILIFVACDVSFFVNHLGWIFFQVVDDSLVVGFGISSLEGALPVFVMEVGVEHAFHLNAHHVAPVRFLRAEVEVVWVGSAQHLAVGEPL